MEQGMVPSDEDMLYFALEMEQVERNKGLDM
jgi:hypothetical protein